MLLVTVEPVDTTSAVLRVSGDIDQDTVPHLERAVERCLGTGHTHLAVDCADLRSFDSSGVTALLRAHQAASARGGTLTLTRAGSVLRSRLELTGLDQVLTLVEDAPALSADILRVPPPEDPSSIEARTESLIRPSSREPFAPAAADAFSSAAQPAPGPMMAPVRSRDALAALEETHAARKEARRQALDTVRPQACRPDHRAP